MLFDYFYGNEAEQFSFYRIPKLLITSPAFKKVSDSAKLLYGLMLDRMSLSLKNGWVDGENRAYIYFTVNDVCEQLCCGTEKATKLMAELEGSKGISLIERKKRGQGKPAIVYLKKFIENPRLSEIEIQDIGESKSQTFDIRKSRVSEVEKQDFRKPKYNNTNINNTEINKTDRINHLSINQSNIDTDGWIDGYNKTVEKIKAQIDYDSLCISHGAELIDEIVNIMAEVMTVEVPYYRIEGRSFPSELVRTMFGKITYGKLEAFLLEFGTRADKIRNPKAYLISALFNMR